MGKKVQQPQTPDFSGMAVAQGAANAEAARVSGKMSNPNVITPYGNQTVTWGGGGTPATEGHYETVTSASGQPYQQWVEGTPGTPGNPDQATITQKLTPEAERTVKLQQQAEMNLADVGNWMISPAQKGTAGTLANVLATPFSFGGTPQQSLRTTDFSMAGPSSVTSFRPVSGANPGQVTYAPNLNALGQAQGVNPTERAISGVQAPTMATGLDESGVARAPINAGTTAQQAIMSRLAPRIAQERVSEETKLTNQGLRPGGEAWDNAMRLFNQGSNDREIQAGLQGLNLDMSANQQGFGQALTRGTFGNEAQLDRFGAGLQNIEQINRAIGQNFGQQTQATGLTNEAIAQNKEAALAQQAAANQAQAQEFGNAQTVQQATNAAQQQWSDLHRGYAADMNSAQQQQYNQFLQSAQFGNAAQQQALAQALQQRQVPLNEIAALMSGSQIQNPTFGAFQGQQVAPAPVFQAGQAQAGWDMSKYQQEVAQRNALTQGLFSLGGAATGMFGFGARRPTG